jgi:DNA-binding FadR family transcriptional regulator
MTKESHELIPRTLADIVSLIEKRNYDPGERLPSERELSERFGVGRGVVREALSILENLRYLKRKPNSGVYLTPTPERVSLEALTLFSELGISLTIEKLSQAMEVRRIIELQAVLLACERRTDADLLALQTIIDAFDAATRACDPSVADLDYQFHMALFKATHNTVLTQMVHPFYIMSASRRAVFFSDTSRCETSNDQHRRLLECIKQMDGATAQQIMAEHIGRVESELHQPNAKIDSAATNKI